MKPQIDKIQTCCRKFLGNSQTVVEAQLNAKDAETVSVLAISADPCVISGDSLSGEVVYAGKVNIKAIICDNDENPASLNYNVDFANKFENENITPDVKLDFESCAVDVSYKTEGNTVSVRCVVETKIYAQIKRSADILTDCQDVNCKTDSVNLCVESSSVNANFTVVDEVEVKHKIGKILLAESNAVLSSVKCGDDVVTAKGSVYTCVTYQTGENNIKSVVIDTPFNEEISADGATCDCIATARLSVKNTKLHMEVVEDEDNRSFTIETELCLNAVCSANQNLQVVTDAFSLTEEINVISDTFENCMPQNYFCFTQKIDGIAETDGKAAVDEILCTTNPKVVAVNNRCNDGTLTVEGILCGNLLYLSEEKIASLDFEIPFVSETDCNCDSICDVVNAAVVEISAKVIRGAVNIDAVVKFGVNCYTTQKFTAVCDIEVLGERQHSGCAIEVLTGKQGMTAWDLQKYLGIAESDIMACNPDLTLPLEKDRKILIYRQIK